MTAEPSHGRYARRLPAKPFVTRMKRSAIRGLLARRANESRIPLCSMRATGLLPIPAARHQPRTHVRRHRRDDAHRLLVLLDRHHDLARVQLQAGRIGSRDELDLARAALARLVAVD